MDTTSSGGQLWPLKSSGAGGENPTLTPGTPTTFQFNDMPDRCPTGPLAYFMPAVLLTIQGSLVQPGGASAIDREVFVQALIDSIDWTNSWFGAPFSKNWNAGTFLPIIEFVAGGFKYGQPQMARFPAAAATYPFSITIAIPACSDKRGRLVRDTSQLALLFQPSQLKVNVAAASVLNGLSTGATLTGLNARLSAVLVPRQEIVLATPMEWVLEQIPVGGNAVKITGFGRDTALTGVEPKGGVAFLGELTSLFGQGGSFLAQNVQNIQFQWRGQGLLQDMSGWVNNVMGGLPNDRPQLAQAVDEGAAGINDFSGFPRFAQTSGTTSLFIDLNSLRFWPWVFGGNSLELTDLQTAETDETYYKTVSPGNESGTHMVLGEFAKQWQPTKRAAFVSLVKQGGPNSLASYVLGSGYSGSTLRPRFPRSKHTLSADQQTYLPWQLI